MKNLQQISLDLLLKQQVKENTFLELKWWLIQLIGLLQEKFLKSKIKDNVDHAGLFLLLELLKV